MNLQDAINVLKEKGYKTTGKRKDILEFFASEDGYRPAKDLIVHLENKYGTISFDTIYRNLHLYHDLGILEKTDLEGEKHFRLSCSHHHHHHFICTDCGKTKEIDICPMDTASAELTNYEIDDHKFEIYGRCPACLNA
ncbi:Fur family transcriptional regulator [Oceanobacillus sp. FSL W8-0428]|uniref:Fur family transcriptional regulator n=1 Tax=Oceanobacillus TaxID=182709 RepID=UPI0009888398|nr:Fur family transcriptional regulator [Oceanobacillus sojae]MCT1904404.1 transcriptional repressor [Oceanobacillus sojae]